MARTESVQDGGIAFGRWKLHALDGRNWELCEMRDGRWRPMGRFYSYNTLHLAIQYAADEELKAGCRDAAMGLEDALHEYERMTQRLAADVARALEGRDDG